MPTAVSLRNLARSTVPVLPRTSECQDEGASWPVAMKRLVGFTKNARGNVYSQIRVVEAWQLVVWRPYRRWSSDFNRQTTANDPTRAKIRKPLTN